MVPCKGMRYLNGIVYKGGRGNDPVEDTERQFHNRMEDEVACGRGNDLGEDTADWVVMQV
jgi:hypothetical protein